MRGNKFFDTIDFIFLMLKKKSPTFFFSSVEVAKGKRSSYFDIDIPQLQFPPWLFRQWTGLQSHGPEAGCSAPTCGPPLVLAYSSPTTSVPSGALLGTGLSSSNWHLLLSVALFLVMCLLGGPFANNTWWSITTTKFLENEHALLWNIWN